MSENNTVRSNGTLQLINGKKIRGELVAGEQGAAFYARGKKEPVAEWHYARMNRMDNIRRGGTTSQITVILKDDTRYVFELEHGLKLYSQMDKNWVDKPIVAKTRGDILHEQAERLGQKIEVPKKHLITRRHPNRSIGGDIVIYLMLLIVAMAMFFPLFFMIGSALKPLDELLRIPPPIWPSHPTLDNFSDLFVTMGKSFVPFSRYLMNTLFITVVGTFGHLVVAGMAAFVLAKYEFPGGRLFFGLVTTCLMFSGYVTGIPNYLIMSKLGMVDTYWSLILPAFCAPMGLFLMKQFMEGLPTALIEAATIDGAGRFQQMLHVTLPGIRMVITLMMVLSLGNVLNAGFDQIYNLYSPVVYETGDILDTMVYRLGLESAKYGPAAAVGMFKSLISCLLVSVSYYVAIRFFDYRLF